MVKHNQYVSALMFSKGMALPVAQSGKTCLMPHILPGHSILVTDLLYFKSLEGREWDFYCFPESSTVPGTKIMVKYIFF